MFEGTVPAQTTLSIIIVSGREGIHCKRGLNNRQFVHNLGVRKLYDFSEGLLLMA